jgi:hypothetical protein
MRSPVTGHYLPSGGNAPLRRKVKRAVRLPQPHRPPFVVLPKRLHHPVRRRMPAVLHLHPVLRPPGLIVEVVTHNDHATIAAQELLERYNSIRQRH